MTYESERSDLFAGILIYNLFESHFGLFFFSHLPFGESTCQLSTGDKGSLRHEVSTLGL